jgi:hypothetical protein
MKKNLFIAFCLTSFLLPGVTRAKETVPEIQLKQKSSFDAVNLRDPFWPIGWKRPGAQKFTPVGPGLSAESFSLTSVTMGTGPHFAILNGKIIEEGQQFGLQVGNQIYQVTLRTIKDGRVVLACQNSEIEVPLHRK